MKSYSLFRACVTGVAIALGMGGWLAHGEPAQVTTRPTGGAGTLLFTQHVRGILETNCVKCHGGEKTKGEFDLTTRQGLLHPGEEGVNVVPGDAKNSKLYKLISFSEDPHMPSKSPKLAEEEIAWIASWIDAGAPYDKPLINKPAVAKGHATVTAEDRQFWSFKPLAKPTVPAVKNAAWCRTDVDHFVLAKLEAKGISPNTAAEKRKLIRRAYFDLIGLPPTPEEVDAFVADASPDAWEKLVERLLDNPHYGERWGRHWLDLARFAESHGYEQDDDRPTAYHYRDFVIRALNQDMPYDQFVKWQLAGDEYEPNNPMAMMATGFLAAGTHATQITANQVEKERYDELDDIASTVGTSMLGMTIGCARCHDHKFDPIPQKDYYRFLSTFTTTVRSEMEIDTNSEENAKLKVAFDAKHRPLVDAVLKFEKEELPARVEQWLKTAPAEIKPQWLVLEADTIKSAGGTTFVRQGDGSYLALGKNADFDTYTFVAKSDVKAIRAIRLEAIADPSMVKGGPGRASNGNFALTDFRVTATDAAAKAMAVKLVRPKATFEQLHLPIAAAIDDDKKSAWAIDPQFGKDHAATFELDTSLANEAGTVLTFTLKFENNTGHNIGRLRLAISSAEGPPKLAADRAEAKLVGRLNLALGRKATERSDEDRAALSQWYRTSDPRWQELKKAEEDDLKNAPRPKLAKMLVCSEGVPALRLRTQGADFFEKSYFLKRGDVNQKDGEATQSFMTVLMPAAGEEKRWQVEPPAGSHVSYRRRSLSNWITDVDGGAGRLLARVIVNRLWQHHMGRGLVSTPNDFGAQGERPTHPELLDFLAQELIRNGWRLKPLHKLMMASSVYMENGDYDEARGAADPENLLLWRRDHHRLEAEPLRDSLLSVSGLLDETMYGPGTLDEGMRRRSIYFFVKRSQLVPMMMLFDAPNALGGLGARSSTTIAPQALAMMNNSHVRDYAKAFAKRLTPEAQKSVEGAVQHAYAIALGRGPDPQELKDSVQFVNEQEGVYKARNTADPMGLALEEFTQALMSLNEFVFVE